MPGIIGSTGWERSSAWIWLFSSTHSTTAFSGGSWYSPTTSTTFSTKNGSVDSLKESCRCGLRSNLFQIRPTVDFDSPVRLAIEARDQCVSLPGVDSSVATITSSTWSSRIRGGLLIGPALRAAQHDLRPQRQVLGGLRAPGPPDQLGPLRVIQHQVRFA